MRILILDDDPEERDAFRQLLEVLYPQSETVVTDNLLEFHEYLFEGGNLTAPFDRIIIDAQLDIPCEIDQNEYRSFLKEVQINENDIESNDLIGWKYFDQVIRKKMPNQLQNVLIKTGFARSILGSSTPKQLEDISILNKGDPDYLKNLKKFLNN